MAPQIRIKNGVAKGAVCEVGDHPLSIGRDPTCDIQLLDKGASRRHSEIFRIGEMCFIRDLESRNGSFVNDVRIDEELLREGDRILIGSTILVFESSAEARPSGIEFAGEEEESFEQTLTLQLEDLSEMSVTNSATDGEAARLRALYRLSRLIAEEREQSKLISKVLEFAAGVVPADSAYLFLPDPVTGNIAPLGIYNKGEKTTSTKVSRSIIKRSLQERRAILTTDAMKDARFSARESIVLKQIHSVICAPLSATGGIGGVLYLASDRPQQVFSEDDLELAAAVAQIAGLALANLRVQREQRETFMNTIRGILVAGEMRDPTIRGRSARMAQYAYAIAMELGLSESQCNDIQLAALLCDLGRMVIDEASIYVHQFEAGMSLEDKRRFATMEILREMNPARDILQAVEFMPERYDGTGPKKLAGAAIPLGGQVLGIASAFEQMAHEHSDVRAEEAIRRALVAINTESGKAFSPDVVKALLIAHRQGTLYSQKAPITADDAKETPAPQEGATASPDSSGAPASEDEREA